MDDKLLQLYFEGRTTAEQSRLVTEWLDADAANMKHYQQLCRLYEIAFWHEKPETVTLSLKEKFRWRTILREAVKIAAVFILGFTLNYWFNPGYRRRYCHANRTCTGRTECTVDAGRWF